MLICARQMKLPPQPCLPPCLPPPCLPHPPSSPCLPHLSPPPASPALPVHTLPPQSCLNCSPVTLVTWLSCCKFRQGVCLALTLCRPVSSICIARFQQHLVNVYALICHGYFLLQQANCSMSVSACAGAGQRATKCHSHQGARRCECL